MTPVVFLDVVEDDAYGLGFTPDCLAHCLREEFHGLGLGGLVPTGVPFDFYPRHDSFTVG